MNKYIKTLSIGLCLSVITYATAWSNVCFLPNGCDDSDGLVSDIQSGSDCKINAYQTIEECKPHLKAYQSCTTDEDGCYVVACQYATYAQCTGWTGDGRISRKNCEQDAATGCWYVSLRNLWDDIDDLPSNDNCNGYTYTTATKPTGDGWHCEPCPSDSTKYKCDCTSGDCSTGGLPDTDEEICADYPDAKITGDGWHCEPCPDNSTKFKCTFDSAEKCIADGYTDTTPKDANCYNCSAICPENGSYYKCTQSVKDGYKLEKGVCKQKTCAEINSSYKTACASNETATRTGKSGADGACYTCEAQTCDIADGLFSSFDTCTEMYWDLCYYCDNSQPICIQQGSCWHINCALEGMYNSEQACYDVAHEQCEYDNTLGCYKLPNTSIGCPADSFTVADMKARNQYNPNFTDVSEFHLSTPRRYYNLPEFAADVLPQLDKYTKGMKNNGTTVRNGTYRNRVFSLRTYCVVGYTPRGEECLNSYLYRTIIDYEHDLDGSGGDYDGANGEQSFGAGDKPGGYYADPQDIEGDIESPVNCTLEKLHLNFCMGDESQEPCMKVDPVVEGFLNDGRFFAH